MSSLNLQARRATVDDLVDLRRLWQKAGWPVGELEKQLTDFQVVETANGVVLGALALQIQDQQGRLHSVACRQSENAEELLNRLWGRVHALARNHGLYRIWTLENAPFWRSLGFEQSTPELQGKLPLGLSASDAWFVLKLRDESAPAISLEHELEAFSRAGRESSERLLRQAKIAKNLAYLILFGAVLAGVIVITFTSLPRSFWKGLFHPSGARGGQPEPSELTTNSAVPNQ